MRRHCIRAERLRLRQALAREEFEVVYQSQYDLVSGAKVGVEGLVRRGIRCRLGAAHFISVAEETGLIVPLGEWVLRHACGDAVSWNGAFNDVLDLSLAQFRDADMPETVARVLRGTGLRAKRLELEITESLLISNTDEIFGKLTRLRELGVRIVMDDFGTGGIPAPTTSRDFRHRQDQDRPAVRAQYDAGPGDAGDRQDHRHAWDGSA